MTLIRSAVVLLAVLLLNGCESFEKKPPATLRIYEQVSDALPDRLTKRVTIPKTNLTLTLSAYPSLTEFRVARAELVETAGGMALLLRFDPHGIMELNELTTRCRGQYLVIFLNNRPVAAWLVDRRLDKGQLLVEGDFTDEEARAAAVSLTKQAIKREAM